MFDQKKHLYDPFLGAVEMVEVPDSNYFTLYGEGPAVLSMHFLQASLTLWKVDDCAKRILSEKTSINSCGNEFRPIEVLWWKEDNPYEGASNAEWKWAIMLRQPQIVTPAVLKKAQLMALEENPDWSLVSSVSLTHLSEGLSLQISRKGTRAELEKVQEVLQAIAKAEHLELTGKYHELYYERLEAGNFGEFNTIIRVPVTEIKLFQII
jgi:hypothetical protein